MQTKVSVLFHLKRSKATSNGLIPIYMRVTINGQRLEISTKRFIEESKWVTAAGKVKGTSEDSRAINSYLDVLRKQVLDHQLELILKGLAVNLDNMRVKVLGKDEKQYSLVSVFEAHNKDMKALVGKEFASGTLQHHSFNKFPYLKHGINVSLTKTLHTFVHVKLPKNYST